MGWLETFFPRASKGRRANLPSLDLRGVRLPAVWASFSAQPKGKQELPNASLIYGIGASGLFVYALYSFFTGSWLTAVLLLFPAGALFGFALHFLRHPS